jgi:uncharacterized protein (DUF1778 family)
MGVTRRKPEPKTANKKKTAKEREPVRRKPDALRKDNLVRLRVTDEQKKTLMEAAMSDGSDLSQWLLSLGLREARRIAAAKAAATAVDVKAST